jgi:hypothetical protein
MNAGSIAGYQPVPPAGETACPLEEVKTATVQISFFHSKRQKPNMNVRFCRSVLLKTNELLI